MDAVSNATEPAAPSIPDDVTAYAEFSVIIDHLWLLIAAFLVFLMQAGFSMLETGSVRAKNAKNIMIKNLVDAAAAGFVWWGFGFPFAYGGGDYSGGPPNGFIGARDFFFIGGYSKCTGEEHPAECLYSINPTIDSFAGWLFQWAFSAAASTIVSGAVAERCRFVAYLAYCVIIIGFIYPVVVHWIWSPYGWLTAFRDDTTPGAWVAMGVVDFAGSGVVHMVGGAAALIGAIILGPRMGRFDSEGKVVDMPAHNASLVGLGTLLLWFGWYGFNPGSTLALSGGTVLIAEKVAVGTTLAASGGGLGAMFMMSVDKRHIDLGPLCNGILAGLVAVCSAVAVAEPWGCFVIGFFAAMVMYGASALLKKLRIDDPLDAAPVHYFGGFFGLICGGLFGTRLNTDVSYGDQQPCGAFFPGCGGQQLGVNILGGVMITIWVMGMSTIVFGALRLAGVLRVPPEEEMIGMDKSHHGGSAYGADVHEDVDDMPAKPPMDD